MASLITVDTQTEDDDAFTWYHILLEYIHADSSAAPLEFHLFPILAPELRFQIWEYALQEPGTAHRTWNDNKFSYSLRRRVPSVLQVCRETRDWFIQEKVLRGRYQLVRLQESQDGGVYLDWFKDRVHIYRGCRYSVSYERYPAY